MTKQPRLADVARAAGVSTATASMALNDTGGTRIGSETRERVRAAAVELGYRPNTVARGLRTRRTQMIGFIGDDVATTTPFAGQMIRGAHDAAREAGFLLLMVDTSGDPAETGEAIAALQERQIDGVLLATLEDVQARAVSLETWRERVAASGIDPDDLLVEVDHATTPLDYEGAKRRSLGETGDNYAVPVDDLLGGFDIAEARPFEHESLYAARLHDAGGVPHLIGFRNFEEGEFVGEIVDPIPVRWDGERLVRRW